MYDISHFIFSGGAAPEVERRIVLLGRAGAGKSASANTINGRHVFLEARWGRFHTTECQRCVVTRYGRKLEVLDTPGFLLDSDITSPKVKREFAKTIGISSPGPHVFVFVCPTPHMHKCDVDVFQKFVLLFGEEVLRYTILLFSKADDLDYFSLTRQAFILSAPPEWKIIMKACNYRCVWFQNRSPPLEKEIMVRTFVQTMEDLIEKNLGQFFCNDLYWTVEKSIIERDITKHQQNKKLEKLRRKLRMNLDAGVKNRYGDTRKDPNRTREDFRKDIEGNNLRLIDTIWNTCKTFDCVQILRRPKLPVVVDHGHRHGDNLDDVEYEEPLTTRSEEPGTVRRHHTTAEPREPRMQLRLPRLPRLEKVQKVNAKQQLGSQTDRGPGNENRIKLPRLVARNR